MTKTFKSILFTATLISFTHFVNAQTSNGVIDKISLEAQYGLNTALSPNEGITTSDFSGFKYFQAGVNYHINDIWGVRGTFAMSNFKNKDVKNEGVKYSKLTLEATYNIFTAINKGTIQPFDVTAHAGFGLGVGKSEPLSGEDIVGVAQIGLMPKYNFSQEFSVFIDGTFVNQFSQDYGFNGLSVKQGSGSYFNVGLGVQYRFGNAKSD